jgi:hypothetical protein
MAKHEKANEGGAPAAVADNTTQPEREAQPQTKEEIQATEKALGLNGDGPKPATTAIAQRAPVRMGVAPTTVEEGWRLAQFIAQSDLVPKGYKNRPADVLVAIQYGMEVGLPPMAALHSIYVTNGRPSLWGDGFLAVIMAAPVYRDHHEYYIVDGGERDFLTAADMAKDDTMAVTTFWRKDSERPRTATFSIAKAKKAGLWTKSGPWTEYPDRMLKYRARGFAGHDAFPDVLRGIKSAEELIDLPPQDDAPQPEPEVRRLSESAPQASAPQTPAADLVAIAPVRVLAVEQFLGGYTVRLEGGQQVDATEINDAAELEKFVGTKHKVKITAKRVEDSLQLQSFEIAD